MENVSEMEKATEMSTAEDPGKAGAPAADEKQQTAARELSEDFAFGEIASEAIFEKDPELAKELAEDRKIQQRAQEYKEKQAKRKKRNRIIAAVSVALLILIAVIVYLVRLNIQKKAEEAASVTEVTAEEGQEIVYVQVVSVAGNEIDVTVPDTGEEKIYQIPVGTTVITRLGSEATFSSISAGNNLALALEEGTDTIDKIWIVNGIGMNGGFEGMPDFENGEMPEGMPEGMDGEMPEGGEMPGGGQNGGIPGGGQGGGMPGGGMPGGGMPGGGQGGRMR